MHIKPRNFFVGGGVYNLQPEELKKIRKEINVIFEEWNKLIKGNLFMKNFPNGIHNSRVLNKILKEFNEPNVSGESLKTKGFYTMEK